MMIKNDSTTARKKRNGFTLVELCVVIALVAIVTVMTVSFSLLIEKDVNKNQTKYEFIEEAAMIRQEAIKWFSYFDQSGTITISPNSAFIGNEPDKLMMLNDGKALFNYGAGQENRIITLEAVKSIEVVRVTDKLVKCTVKCTDVYGEELSQTFMIALRIASVGGAS